MAGTTCESVDEYFRRLAWQAEHVGVTAVAELTKLLFEAWRSRRRVYIFGNGGSASTAGHYATDLVKTAAVVEQPRLRAISLVDNIGITTAVARFAAVP